jgi:hypothetical protein
VKKTLIAMLLAVSFAAPVYAQQDVHVNPYQKKDGTQVDQHHRTTPNDTKYDNWSSKGNTNPYTGEKGHKNPEPDPYKSSQGSEKKKSAYGY